MKIQSKSTEEQTIFYETETMLENIWQKSEHKCEIRWDVQFAAVQKHVNLVDHEKTARLKFIY